MNAENIKQKLAKAEHNFLKLKNETDEAKWMNMKFYNDTVCMNN